MLQVGTACTVHSFKERPELNGRFGTVITKLNLAKGRAGAQIEGEKEPLAVKFVNLMVVGAPLPAYLFQRRRNMGLPAAWPISHPAALLMLSR